MLIVFLDINTTWAYSIINLEQCHSTYLNAIDADLKERWSQT